MQIQQAIQQVLERRDLSREQMRAVMQSIMTGEASAAQIGGFLIGLRMKGETVDEICGAAEVMRALATRVDVDVPHLVDTCGTGGDGLNTFNISTASAFVAAAAGAHVAKHGNRSVSSSCGSADLLEQAGVRIDLDAGQVAACIREVGVGFMFAPRHHGAMKHAIGPRKEMAVRTIFNVLGPLTNPAAAPCQVIGVFDPSLTEPLARVLGELGSRHVLVVHSEDGMDEISSCAPTRVSELRDGAVASYDITPEQFGFDRGKLDELNVDGPQASLELVRGALGGTHPAAVAIVALNAGAALYASGRASNLGAGIEGARAVLRDGTALTRMERLADFTNRLGA